MNQLKFEISTFHCSTWIKPIKAKMALSLCDVCCHSIATHLYRIYMKWIAKDRALIRSECCIFSRFFPHLSNAWFLRFLLSFFLSMSKNHLKRSTHTIIMLFTFIAKYATKFIRKRKQLAKNHKKKIICEKFNGWIASIAMRFYCVGVSCIACETKNDQYV